MNKKMNKYFLNILKEYNQRAMFIAEASGRNTDIYIQADELLRECKDWRVAFQLMYKNQDWTIEKIEDLIDSREDIKKIWSN